MRLLLHSAALIAAAVCPSLGFADDQPAASPPGLGDPGQLVKIQIVTGRAADGKFVIAGRDAGQQLLVHGQYDSKQIRDLTRDVNYRVEPAGIVEVDATGHVTPLAEGETWIYVDAQPGITASVAVQVTHIVDDLPVNFPNQIVPIFTKYGCNGGGCHGKSGGQNGFKLSLLGFEPGEDYEWLVKEARGRRLFPAAPHQSLLLQKATAELPHGGGQRIDLDSPAYSLLRRWVAQGMPYGSDSDPKVARIEVFPDERLMGRNASQQLVAIAHYTDGSSEDVTRMTQFDSNDPEMAEVNVTGLVTTAELTGSVAVMARYQGHVGVYRATVPLGIEVAKLPREVNFIDRLVFEKLKALGLPPSQICDDSTFLRRVTLDIAGRLPTAEETDAFLADDSATKREALVDRLLASTDYADYFANKWNAILRNKRNRNEDRPATFAFHNWIRQSLHENKSYDQFVREVLTATGTVRTNPAVAWYREVKDQAAQVEDTAQLFLGLRIQCARCHHHPFEVWSQRDYYGFAAYFSRVSRKSSGIRGQDRVYHRRGTAAAKNPKTDENVPPTGLGSEALPISPDDDPRHALVDWMADPENPFFAKSLVNRYWKHFFGRGLVDPEDDMRVTNPACNPELLDALALYFVDSQFDMKQLIREICTSSVYQLDAQPNQWNADDKQNFSRYYPKRLNAEVLLDAIDDVTLSSTNFGAIPAGTRATQLPDNGFSSYFLTVFGRPESSSACECERSSEANLAQSLHLLNSSDIQNKLTSGSGRAAKMAAEKEATHEVNVRRLYKVAFSREPLPDELRVAVEYLAKAENPKQGYEDLVWVLINTKEFLFNH